MGMRSGNVVPVRQGQTEKEAPEAVVEAAPPS